MFKFIHPRFWGFRRDFTENSNCLWC